MRKNNRTNVYGFILASIVSVCAVGAFAHAATYSVSPETGVYDVGDEFTVTIVADSPVDAFNALSGELSYPQQIVQVVSLSTSNSVVPFWIQNPKGSNGVVSFEGMIPNPGFSGSDANVIEITLEATEVGSAILSFNSGSILANDGLASELLESTSGAVYTISEPVVIEPPEDPVEDPIEEPTDPDAGDTGDTGDSGDPGDSTGDGGAAGGGETPDAPNVVSVTHPDSEEWYQDDEVTIEWGSPTEIDGVRVSVTEDEPGVPDQEIDPNITSYTFSVEDGVWYANTQFRNSAGWGEVGSYRVRVDTIEPSDITVRQVASDEIRPGTFSSDFNIEAVDIPSGIDYFEITVDGNDSLRWKDPGTSIFRVEGLEAGEHRIIVRGYDHAGNSAITEATFEFTVFDPIGVGKTIEENPSRPDRLEDVPLPQTVPPEVVSVVSYAGFGAGLGQMLMLSANALSFADIWLLILRFFSFIASFFRRRKSEPWGVVYDSVTKQPLDPAYVVIKLGGKQEGMAITDLDGRYGFLVAPGVYTLEANKTHYKFPSEKLAGRKHDEFYDNLYFGEEIAINTDQKSLVNYNIPLDPVDFDWNEYAKRERGLFNVHSRKKRLIMIISNTIFFAGMAISIYVLWHNPSILNVVITSIYALILLYQSFWRASHPITKIMTLLSQKVIPFAVIKAHLSGNDQLVKTVVADENGHFYMLTPPGEYYFTVEVKEVDGSYSEKYRTDDVQLRKGVVLKNVYVNRNNVR